MAETVIRTEDGVAIPAAGRYTIDPAHSAITFQVRHLGLSKVRGSFESFSGTVDIDDDPTKSSVEVDIDAASFTTGVEDRDNHIKSPDFLDIEQFPTLTFRTTAVRQEGERWKVDGELTVKDASRPVTLDVEFEGAGEDPWENARVGFSASTEIDREDWGVNWNQTLETGGLLVGKRVRISLDVEAIAES